MTRRSSWHKALLTAQDEALLAAKLYNEPFIPRVFEGFVVHMHLAWLYLLQARFIQDGVEFRVRQSRRKDRFEIVDGEHKTWDLAASVRERWKDDPANPVRMNLEFFIKLRNRIEHRYSKSDDSILIFVSDKSHALLLNFEEEMTNFFGSKYSLANKLRFPVFIGTFTEPGTQTILKLNSTLPSELKAFVAVYDSGMDESILSSSKYSLRLRVSLEKVTSDADMSITFVREDDLTDEKRAEYDADAKSGKVIVKDRDFNQFTICR
jgi:hypothetical protein